MRAEASSARRSATENGDRAATERNGGLPLPEALDHCRHITRSRARNFYYGLKLLPEPQRSAMYALYAWMRAADDLVDGAAPVIPSCPDIPAQAGIQETRGQRTDDRDSRPGSLAAASGSCAHAVAELHARIETFRQSTTRALNGQPPASDPMWVGLAFAAERFNLSEEPFHAMLAGQLDDLRERRYDTFEQLREYCYRVASTVGLLCIEIWGYSDPAAKELAIERGIAFQLTNILRDFREDYDAGRVYLPREDFEAHGITPAELRKWSPPKQCEAFIVAQVDRASGFYDSSSRLDELISPPCLPTLWAMTTIYRSILRKISDDPPMLVSDRRVRLSFVTKTVIALRARTGRLIA